ncbi:GTPase-activator protein [Tritrichomonas foetus]|uniref:GTPase-activator protein n=1 Tax=Tritrichomonas foetus TaxID=1144522 RepID=A0A1J4KT13_9EUKA|nr:GTPase-activator protein [Tritrichomonas foetus]|eukprot:OHT12924.1 GTPase-activator protein [Tritrichomonas foetus]
MEANKTPSTATKYVFFHLAGITGSKHKLEIVNKELSYPQYPFELFKPEIELLIPEVEDSTFAQSLRDPYDDFFDFQVIIADLIGTNDISELFEHPTEPLEQLLEGLKGLFSADFIHCITDTFPINATSILTNLSPPLQKSCAAIAALVHENSMNDQFISWIGNVLIPSQWHGCTSSESTSLKLGGLFMKYRMIVKNHNPHWAVLTPQNDITIYRADDLTVIDSFHVSKIESSRSGRSIRIIKDSNVGARLIPFDNTTFDTWLTNEPLVPCSLPYSSEKIPKIFLDNFEYALIQPDTYLLRAIIHKDVLKIRTAQETMEDLFTIFAYHDLIHRFVMTVCAFEFSQPDVTESNLLQHNSCVIFLFRVYYKKFGRLFFDNVLRPIIDKIDEVGPLGINSENSSKVDQVGELLNWVIDKFLTGSEYIPLEFRHITNVLKSVTATTLRSRRAVYNALSSFLCLRFSTAIIADPLGYDERGRQPVDMQKISVPFAQLLQLPLSLQPISERYNHLAKLDDQIIGRFEEIYNYVVSMSECFQPVFYDKPGKDDVIAAIKRIMGLLNSQRSQFVHRYRELYENDTDNTASAYAMSEFITKLFK